MQSNDSGIIGILWAGRVGLALSRQALRSGFEVLIAGMPPLKWSTHRDILIPFSGGPEDGWQAREARRYCAEAASS